jgi:hypothetical protein
MLRHAGRLLLVQGTEPQRGLGDGLASLGDLEMVAALRARPWLAGLEVLHLVEMPATLASEPDQPGISASTRALADLLDAIRIRRKVKSPIGETGEEFRKPAPRRDR